MKLRCPVNGSDCPLLDYGHHYWCNTNHDPYAFEICPFPKKRNQAIKERLRKATHAIRSWERATFCLSGIGDEEKKLPAFQELVDLDTDVVPFVLTKLCEGAPWIWMPVLEEILEGSPRIPKKDWGKLEPVREAYLRWAKNKGFNPA